MNNNEISFLLLSFIVNWRWNEKRIATTKKKKVIHDNELQDETSTWRAAVSVEEKFFILTEALQESKHYIKSLSPAVISS